MKPKLPLIVGNSLVLIVGVLTLLSDITFFCWEYFSISSQSFIFTFTFFPSYSFSFYFSWFFDLKTLLFLTSVSLISVGVMGFSSEYMKEEKFFSRFHWLVVIFVMSMFLLIMGGDLMSILIGWDGLGVSSFLLVVYFQNSYSWGAGMLTVMTNRIGDVLLILSCALLAYASPLEPSSVSLQSTPMPFAMALLIIFAAATKSAQLPFSAWLPAAMAAPTPVSSLVHSSTLVTAGVYLLTRFENVFANSSTGSILLGLGALTMSVAGRAALWEPDLKKLVALSTLSQLGLMVATLGMGHSNMGFFHLIMHAFFKSLLFMAAGAMIHALGDYQDMRMVSLSSLNAPFALSLMSISNLALMGLPFMSGFYSKDLILETTFIRPMSFVFWFLFFMGTAMTMAYSMRFMFLLAGTSGKQTLFWSGEQGILMLKTCGAQLICAVLGGRLLVMVCPFESSFIFMEEWMKLLVLFLMSMFLLLSRVKMMTFFSGVAQKSLMMGPGSIGMAPSAVKALSIPRVFQGAAHILESSELSVVPSFYVLRSLRHACVWPISAQTVPTYFMGVSGLVVFVLVFSL